MKKSANNRPHATHKSASPFAFFQTGSAALLCAPEPEALELKNMDIASLVTIGVFSIIWLWLVVVSVVALKYDNTLEPFQRKAQMLIVLLVPFFGSALILHLDPAPVSRTLS